MRRVLVCGERTFGRQGSPLGNAQRVCLADYLDALHAADPISCLIHGDALGADTAAANWAARRGIPVEAYPADWPTYGPAAGPIRNAIMLRDGRPDVVVAFPGGTGTAGMVRLAEAACVPVLDPMATAVGL